MLDLDELASYSLLIKCLFYHRSVCQVHVLSFGESLSTVRALACQQHMVFGDE